MSQQSSSGSGVRFMNAQGTMVAFDMPPNGLVSPIMLRHAAGKRLRKWFAWDGETFVLRKKVEEGRDTGAGE